MVAKDLRSRNQPRKEENILVTFYIDQFHWQQVVGEKHLRIDASEI